MLYKKKYIFVHNWSLRCSFSYRVLCFYTWMTSPQFNFHFELQIYVRNFSWQLLCTLRGFSRNMLRKSRRMSFCKRCLSWNGSLMLNQPSQHQLLNNWLYSRHRVFSNTGSAKYLFFWIMLKKNYWIFSQISFLKLQCFRLIKENNFIQIAALGWPCSSLHYQLCAAVFHQWLHEYCP